MNDAAFEALAALLLTHAKIVRASDAKIGGHHGLSLNELMLLRAIVAKPEFKARPTELARELHLSASGVTRALLPLEKRGIVRREPDPADGRASFAALTAAGQELVADASATAAQAAEKFMHRLSLGQTRQMIRLLEEVSS
jgi:DNA-binding MarR family transcriptional regulator